MYKILLGEYKQFYGVHDPPPESVEIFLLTKLKETAAEAMKGLMR